MDDAGLLDLVDDDYYAFLNLPRDVSISISVDLIDFSHTFAICFSISISKGNN